MVVSKRHRHEKNRRTVKNLATFNGDVIASFADEDETDGEFERTIVDLRLLGVYCWLPEFSSISL